MQNNSKIFKAVVTGGAGFIGSHIVDECVKRGWEVIVLDNLSTGRIENIQSLINTKKAQFIRGNIIDLPLLQKLFSGVDYVFHEAAITSVPMSVADPAASNEANVTGTLNVLIAAKENKVKKLILASSSSVYGDTPTLPNQEDMIPEPQSPYALTKMAGEYYCGLFTKIYGLPTACLRYFNVYGPRQDPNSQYSAVIPKFIQSIHAGKSPVIFGDGVQSRDFVYVKDVANANLLAAESEAQGVYNIGTGRSVSLNQLLETILVLMKRDNIKPVYMDARPGDIKHSLADIRRAGDFGYAPEYGLDQGLSEMLTDSHT